MNKRLTIRILICLLTAVLALKFGSFVGNGEQANFPSDIWEWLLFTGWPCYLASAFCGLLLIAVALLCGHVGMNRCAVAPALWLLPILAGLFGLINSTEADYASQWMLHFLGAFTFCATVWIATNNDRGFLPVLAAAIGIIGIIACLHGWYQHFIGLEETREYAIKQMTEQGLNITPQILAKMEQTRIYGNYVDPNVYASHILFCMPFALFALHSFGSKMEQPKISSITLTSIGAILFLCTLYWTGSRGAAIGMAAGIAIAVWSLNPIRNWRFRWCLPALGLLGVILLAAFFIIMKSRDGMASASARLIYYKTAIAIFIRHPLAGAGLGEFFPWYLRLKPIEAEITRDPHNFLLSFMVQSGTIGALAAIALLLFPWVIATFKDKSLQDNKLQISAITALTAWLVHSMFQFNEIFPGTLFLAAASTVFIIAPDEQSETQDKKTAIAIRAVAIATGAICLMALMRIPGERLLRQGEILQSKNPNDALPAFTSATVMLPHALMPPKASFDIHFAKGDWAKAADAASILIRRAPHRASSYIRLALAQLALNKFEAAEESLRHAIEWYPSSPEALIVLAVVQRQKNSSYLLDSTMLARQLHASKAWAFDKGDHILVTYMEANNDLLGSVLKETYINYIDGRKVVFKPSQQDQP